MIPFWGPCGLLQGSHSGSHCVAKWGTGRKPVEIQLHTRAMHHWANMVEQVSGALGINYKQDGREDFQLWAKSLSSILEHAEQGSAVPTEALDEYGRLRMRIQAGIGGGALQWRSSTTT